MQTTTTTTIHRKAKDACSYSIDTSVENVVLAASGAYKPSTLSFLCYRTVGLAREAYSGQCGMIFYNASLGYISHRSSAKSEVLGLSGITIPSGTRFIECVVFGGSATADHTDMYVKGKRGLAASTEVPLCSKTISAIEEGGEGSRGPAGPVIRPCGLWKSGMPLVNNSNFIDVVCIADATGEPLFFKLKDSFSSNAGFESASPVSDTTRYEKAENLGFVASAVLLGNTGYINILGSARILVAENGTDGWELTNGAIRHTVTGVELTKDGRINDPTGLSITVGDCNEPRYNMMFNAYQDLLLTKIARQTGNRNSLYTGCLLEQNGKYGKNCLAAGGFNMDTTADAVFETTMNGGSETGKGVLLHELGKYTFSVIGYAEIDDDSMRSDAAVELFVSASEDMSEAVRLTTLYMDGRYRKLSYTFNQTKRNMYFAWRTALNICRESDVTAYIDAVKLEKGDTASEMSDTSVSDKLLPTGIDIHRGRIDVVADNFTVMNSSGAESMGVDEEGNVKVHGTIEARHGFFEGSIITKFADTEYDSGNGFVVGENDNLSNNHKQGFVYLPSAVSNIGRRIILYNDCVPPFNVSGQVRYTMVRCENGARIKGILRNDFSIFDNSITQTNWMNKKNPLGIDFLNGCLEFIGVPDKDGEGKECCGWVLLNRNCAYINFPDLPDT